MPCMRLILLALSVYISGQGADKNFPPEVSLTPSSTLKCSWVRIGHSVLATVSEQDSGSGRGWLYPDNSTSETSVGLDDSLHSEYSLVCDSVQTSSHSEETNTLFPSSSSSSSFIVLTKLATVTIESTPVSAFQSRTLHSASSSMILAPGPEDIVEIRLVLSESQHALLQDSESSERAALEAALANEYLQSLNSSSRERTKRQTQSSVIAKVTEIGQRNSSTGETPILFYIVDGSNPIPAFVVVNTLASLSNQEIDGYPVISIVASPWISISATHGTVHTAIPEVPVSAIASPSANTAPQSGMSGGMMGGVVVIAVVACVVAVLLIALTAYALNRKFAEEDHKREVTAPPPVTLYELDLLQQLRARRRPWSADHFSPLDADFFNPPNELEVGHYNEGPTSQLNEQRFGQLQHDTCVRRLHEWKVKKEREMQLNQLDEENDSQEIIENHIAKPDKAEEKQTSQLLVRQPDDPWSDMSEATSVGRTQIRQVSRSQMSQMSGKQEREVDKKAKPTVTFCSSHVEIPSSEMTITPSNFSAVSNLSQISQSQLDLDITQPQVKYM